MTFLWFLLIFFPLEYGDGPLVLKKNRTEIRNKFSFNRFNIIIGDKKKNNKTYPTEPYLTSP